MPRLSTPARSQINSPRVAKISGLAMRIAAAQKRADAVLAALGAVLQERRGLDARAYAARHPAGALGRQARDA